MFSETNREYFPTKNLLIELYNRDAVCLLRGTDLIFTYKSG